MPTHGPRNQAFPKVTPYDGSTDFHAFAAKFEIIAKCCQWDDQNKLLHLVSALTGKALDCYAWQEPEVMNNYTLVKDQLMKMFGKIKDPIIQRAELAAMRQRDEETIEEFGQRVRQIATRAYPTANTEVFETIAREAFLKGCSDVNAAELALYRDPQTLNQAIKFTQTAAHNHNLLSKNKPKVRHVSFSDVTRRNDESV